MTASSSFGSESAATDSSSAGFTGPLSGTGTSGASEVVEVTRLLRCRSAA